MKFKKQPISLKKKSVMNDLDLDENLNINKEIIKTSNKVLNTLINNRINTDSNKIIKNNSNLRGTINFKDIKENKVFSDKQIYTKKELRKTMSGFFNKQKRASINNFREFTALNTNNKKTMNHSFNIRNLNVNKLIKKNYNYITYDDFYFEDDMFIPESSSFPNENEEDFLLKLQFIEENDYNEDIIDFSKRSNSISHKIDNKDNIHMKYFSNKEKKIDKKSSELKIDDLFFEENEIKGKNILFLDNQRNSNNIHRNNSITKTDSNESNISFISINLFIKKIAFENFRNNYPDVMKCFMQQFKYFIPINKLIKKLISAFNFYRKLNKNSTELILLLDEIILENYYSIIEDKNLIEQIKNFYSQVINIKWNNLQVKEHIKTINSFLLNKDFEVNKKKNSNNISFNNNRNTIIDKRYTLGVKSKSFFGYKKSNKEIKEKSRKHNYNYFYIFDYTKEELAAYLTIDSYQLISNIPIDEFFNKKFCSKTKEKSAPNIIKITNRASKLVLFIVEDICSYDHKSERVEAIEKWLKVAFACLEMKNFNDLIMLNSLFCSYLFKKMKLTWQKIPKKTLNYIEKLKKFCSGNQCYINIRKEMFKCKGKAHVPYLGILLKEIMGIEELKYIIDNSNINVRKLLKLNQAISHFFEFRHQKYNFGKSNNLEILSNINPLDSEEIEEIIKQLEPKLTVSSKKGDKKRITNSDKLFYK